MSRYSPVSLIFLTLILCLVVLLPQGLQSSGVSFKDGEGSKGVPIFVAHRGDKVLIPEHTIPAYDQAMLDDVEFVEPDLMMTKDQVLVCHHDITLKSMTDVANITELASLMRQNVTLFLDGKNVTILDDWLIPDLTLDQLKKLKVFQQDKGVRPQHFNGIFRIPTFQEYIDAVHKDTWRRRKFKPDETFVMGMIPELKHPDVHNDPYHTAYVMETKFISEMRKNGYLDKSPSCKYQNETIPCSPLIVQCFNVDTIRYLSVTTDFPLLTLLDTQNLKYLTYQGMAGLANATQYLGIWKEHLFTGTQAEVDHNKVPYDPDEIEKLGGFVEAHKIVDYAHGLGMKVGIYTIYQSYEPSYRGCAKQCLNDTKETELNYYFDLGVDAFFIEGICESLRIRDKYISKHTRGGGASGGGGSISKNFYGRAPQILFFVYVCLHTSVYVKF